MLNVYKLLLELFSFSFFFISVYDTVFYLSDVECGSGF